MLPEQSISRMISHPDAIDEVGVVWRVGCALGFNGAVESPFTGGAGCAVGVVTVITVDVAFDNKAGALPVDCETTLAAFVANGTAFFFIMIFCQPKAITSPPKKQIKKISR